MPGNAIKVTCTRCVPPTSVCSVQQFNHHVRAKHRNCPLPDLCAMIAPGTHPPRYTVCPVQDCLEPFYAYVAARAHFNKHHPGEEVPQLPDNAVSVTELLRRDIERRRLLQSTAANDTIITNNNSTNFSIRQGGTTAGTNIPSSSRSNNAGNRGVTASTASAAPTSGIPVRISRPPGGAFGISRQSSADVAAVLLPATLPASPARSATIIEVPTPDATPADTSATEVSSSSSARVDTADPSSSSPPARVNDARPSADAAAVTLPATPPASSARSVSEHPVSDVSDDTAPATSSVPVASTATASDSSPSTMPNILNPIDDQLNANIEHPAVSDASVDDTAPATSSAHASRRRSPRLRQPNTIVARRRIATVLNARRAPDTAASAATDNVPAAPTNAADNTAPPPAPRNARGRPATRRNPALVQVNHNVAPDIVANDDAVVQAIQNDADLAVRRRNNITRRNNRRHVPPGNFDLLPHTVEELVINEDDLKELEALPDTDFEEHFFGFHHPRLETIHYTYIGEIQLVVVKLLRVIVENMELAVPSLATERRCRSGITALQCLVMIIRCISYKRQAHSTSNTVKEFLTYWNSLPQAELAGSLLCYAAKARAFALGSEYRPRVYNSVRSVIKSTEKLMQQTKYTRALSTLTRHLSPLVHETQGSADPAMGSRTLADQIALTTQLHPPHNAILDNVQIDNVVAFDAPPKIRQLNAASIQQAVHQLDTTASEGVDSWNNFHLKKIILHIDTYGNNINSENDDDGTIHNEVLDLLLRLVRLFIAAKFNSASLWSLSRLIYVPKPNDPTSLRPIAIGSTWYRLLANIIASRVSEETGALLAPLQIGVGIKDGGGILANMMKGLTTAHPELCILSFDIANAFNTERRGRTAAGVAKYCPVLLPLYQRLYGIEGSSLRNSLGQLVGQSGTGVRQGDPLAMLFFCCSIHDTLIEVNNALKQSMSTAPMGSTLYQFYMQGSYADDLNICLPVLFAEDVFETTIDIFENNGYGLNRHKSTIFLSDRYQGEEGLNDVNSFFPRTSQNVVFRKRILGIDFGSDADVQLSLQAHLSDIQRLLALLKHVPASIAFYLVKYCINAMPGYIHRILPPSITQSWLSMGIDQAVIESIEHMIGSSIPATTRFLIKSPCKLDGLGITAWHDFVPKVQYDVLQHRTVEFMQKYGCVFSNIAEVVKRRREVFSNGELGFMNAVRDYITHTSSKRSAILHTASHANYTSFLRANGRDDIIRHMDYQRYPGQGLLFGMNYIRNSFTKDDAFFSEALAYRLKVPIIIAPDPVDIPPPRPYQCLYCDTQRRRYDIATTLFEHCVSCKCASADVIHRHDATVTAIMNYIHDVRGASVEVTAGTRENTDGDRGQICDFVIRKRGRADVKFDITYSSGVDAPQLTSLLLPAPLDSIVTAENHKRAHYQRNDNTAGDVIPLAFSFSGYCLGPSFIAFCNTIEAPDAQAQHVFDYTAINGVKFNRDFHPARRRLLCEITRLSYLFIAKARIRCRQQVYRPNIAEDNGPPPVFVPQPMVFLPPFIPPLIHHGQPPVGPWHGV